MITNIKSVLHRVNPLAVAAMLILAALIPVLAAQQTSALGLLSRKLMVSSTNASDDNVAPDGSTYTYGGGVGQVPAGDPRNGTKVDHTYTFTVPTAGAIQGFTIEYCQTAFAYVGQGVTGCTIPGGFSASAWDGGTVTIDGEVFDIDDNGVGNYLTFTAQTTGMTATANEVVTINLPATESRFFANPNTAYITDTSNGTYFAHISTYAVEANAVASYADADQINGLIDEGTVTNNVTESISIYTRVQETLNFSVEGDDADDGPTSDYEDGDPCVPLIEDGLVNIGDGNNALDATQPYYGRSYFRLATNSSGGVQVFYSGNTLTSGANSITEIGDTATASAFGTEQWGMAFDQGDSELAAVDNVVGVDGQLSPVTAYDDTAAGYAFEAASVATPELLASAGGVVQCDTGSLEYIANISADTEAGIYTTKINYIALPTY